MSPGEAGDDLVFDNFFLRALIWLIDSTGVVLVEVVLGEIDY